MSQGICEARYRCRSTKLNGKFSRDLVVVRAFKKDQKYLKKIDSFKTCSAVYPLQKASI
jgi:hypothetical protein